MSFSLLCQSVVCCHPATGTQPPAIRSTFLRMFFFLVNRHRFWKIVFRYLNALSSLIKMKLIFPMSIFFVRMHFSSSSTGSTCLSKRLMRPVRANKEGVYMCWHQPACLSYFLCIPHGLSPCFFSSKSPEVRAHRLAYPRQLIPGPHIPFYKATG